MRYWCLSPECVIPWIVCFCFVLFFLNDLLQNLQLQCKVLRFLHFISSLFLRFVMCPVLLTDCSHDDWESDSWSAHSLPLVVAVSLYTNMVWYGSHACLHALCIVDGHVWISCNIYICKVEGISLDVGVLIWWRKICKEQSIIITSKL